MKSFPPAAVNAKALLHARQRPVSSFFLAGVCVCLFLFNCVSSPPAEKSAADTISTTYTKLLPPCGRLQMSNSLKYPVPVLVHKKKAKSFSAALQIPPPSSRPTSPASFSLSSSSTHLSSSVSPESASSAYPPFLCITSLGPFSFASLSPFLSTLSSGVRTLQQGALQVLRLLLFFSGSLDCFLPIIWQPPRLSFLPSASFSPLTAASHHPQTANSNFLLQQQLPHSLLQQLVPHTLAAASGAVPSVPSMPTRSKSMHHKGASDTISSTILDEGDTAESGGEKSNSVSSSEQSGLSAEVLKQFYSSFPDPAPPPTGIIELDIATWDLIVDVVTSPHRSREEGSPHVQEQHRPPLNMHMQQQQQQRQQQQGEELLQGLHAGAEEDVFVKLEHSAVPTPPRLWLVAFMASGCMHCQRLRPVLQQLQRLYTSKLRRLRAARRHALARLQHEATAALSVAAAATARAQHDLLQLGGGKTPEAAVKIAEQHAVMMQQEEQTLQQKLLQQLSQLYSAAATATWAYPDTVFVAFDCMQDREHQHLCRDVLGISKFPEVLLLRKLPSLSSLTARAAEQPLLPISVPCPSSLLPQATSVSPAPAAAGVPPPTAADASDDRADVAEGASAFAARPEKEKEEMSFSSSPLLRERLMQQRSVGLRPWAARGSTKKDRGRTALLCALQEELLAEFPPFTIPSLQQLLLFLYSSTAEAASWAPVVPPPVGFLQRVLLHSVTSSSAVAADSAVGPAAGVDADAAAEERGRRASEAREKAAAVAASAAATFLKKEQRYRNSNTFPTWLAKRMRGEAVRQVFSREEIRLLHYGTAAAASSSSGSCSSPAVSFLVCVNLSRTLQTERGEPARSPLLVHQVQQHRYSQHQQHSPRQQQQEESQQQHRLKEERLKRIATVVAGEVVRLDGLRDAFETYAAAAAELRRHHLFLYSLNPAACAPQGLQSEGSSTSAAQKLLLKMRQQHAAADTAAAAAQGRADGGPRAAVDGEMDSITSHWEQQQQYPLRVVALQPTLLVQGTEEKNGEDKQRTCGDKEEEADAVGGAAHISSSSSNREERVEEEQYEEQDGEGKGSSSAREQQKVLLLQRVLEGIWAAQRTVAVELQEREEHGGDRGEKTRRAAGDFVDEDAEKTAKRCVLEGGGTSSQGRCVDPREEQPQAQRQMYQQEQPQERGGSCVLEENDRVNAMQLPTFVGPFPPRLDQLKTSASARRSAAAAASFLYAAVSSPPLASFLDVFRIPTLSLVGDKNFMQLRVSSSRSWLPTAGSSSSSNEGSLAMGSRQLVVAVLDLRVLDMLLAMFTKSQIAAAVNHAVQQQQEAAMFTLTTTAAADEDAAAGPVNTEGGGNTRPREEKNLAGRTEGVTSRLQAAEGMQTDSSKGSSSNSKRGSGGWLWDVFSSVWSFTSFAADSGRTALGLSELDHLAAAPAYSTSEPVSRAAPPTRLDIVAGALSGVAPSGSISSDVMETAAAPESSRGRAGTMAAASQLMKLVEELWQLSWTARKVLLQSRVDLFKQLLDSDSSDNSWYTTDCRSRLPLFTSPFLFGILDGFTYSEALADYDIQANEEGELPAVLAFDSVLPAGGRRTSPPSSSSRSACRSGSSSSSLSGTGDTESRRSAHERSREGVESCRSPGSNCGVGDFTGQCSGGGETATQSAEWRTKKEGRVVPYYYRDRLRLRLDDLPRGLYLLRRQAIEGRRLAEEEEEDEDDDSEPVVTGNVFQLFWRAIESLGTWRAVFRKASRSRFGMFRLVVSLIAFLLVLACSAILMFYSVCCPSRDSADDGGQEGEAEADTDADDSIGTADTDTEDETNDEEVQEGGKKLEARKENNNTFTTTTDREHIREKTDAGKAGEDKHKRTFEGGSSSDSSSSSNPTTGNDQTEMLSIEEVHRRAQEMLRSMS